MQRLLIVPPVGARALLPILYLPHPDVRETVAGIAESGRTWTFVLRSNVTEH